MNRADLISEIIRQLKDIHLDHPLRIGIDGVDASGKTIFADALAAAVQKDGWNVIRASVDGFHHPAKIRKQRGADSPIGCYQDTFNYPELIDGLLKPLGPCGSSQYRTSTFDYRTDSTVESPSQTAKVNAILVFDGIFLHRPELIDFWDYSIFLRADFATILKRAEFRDQDLFGSPEAVRKRYNQKYIPAQKHYLTKVQPEKKASMVINNINPQDPERATPNLYSFPEDVLK